MFDADRFIEETTANAEKTIDGNAVIAVSGGVDSTVAAVLVSRAIGDRLTAVHVDTGGMRKLSNGEDESEYVVRTLEEYGVNAILVDAKKRFFDARIDLEEAYKGEKDISDLEKGMLNELEIKHSDDGWFGKELGYLTRQLREVVHPEVKRRIIGNTFIHVFEEEAKKVNAKWLVQGTLAPDWIESGDGKIRDNIKSHHNVGGLPKKMGLKLYEPLHELYKDEGRKVGRALDLPAILTERQPFPGPGLHIRVIDGPANEENVAVVREADYIWVKTVEEALASGAIPPLKEPFKDRQYLAVYFPNAHVVGVHGDVRTHLGIVALRCVDTVDYMTANFTEIPYDVIETASSKITNTLKDNVTGVVYDVSNKPPRTIEFE